MEVNRVRKCRRETIDAAGCRLAMLIALAGTAALAEAGDDKEDPDHGKPNTHASDSASLTGTIRYHRDPKRPWRYARYYIADPKKRFLAEAVVVLVGKDLKEPEIRNPSTQVIDQRNFQFIPETLAIHAGDKVTFTNSDDALHNVMCLDATDPFNVTLTKGATHAHVFEKARTLSHPAKLGCVYHGSMRAWIFVFDHPWFQVTGRDGQFSLQNVPVGKYELSIVHPAGKLARSQPVEVKQGHPLNLTIDLSPDDIKNGEKAE